MLQPQRKVMNQMPCPIKYHALNNLHTLYEGCKIKYRRENDLEVYKVNL